MARILIVDDSDAIRSQLKQTLEENQHMVVEGENGLRGLEALKSHTDIALIICDVNMPEMDGLTMCQKVKEIPEKKSIPILMLTTEAGPEMKAKGKELGLTGWIVKPFNPQKLNEVIKKLVKA